jgi:steroid delta-isomerase-like uncharacterized protein
VAGRVNVSRAEIEAFFSKRQRAFDAHDARALAADYAEDGVVESPLIGGEAKGREAIIRLYDAYFRAFTDLTLAVDRLLIDDQQVALVATASGTDLGGFMGMEPTGRAVRVSVVFLFELAEGLIVRERRIYDFTGLLVQVGILKAKPR